MRHAGRLEMIARATLCIATIGFFRIDFLYLILEKTNGFTKY